MLRIVEWMNSYDGSILPYALCYLAACLVLAVPVMYLLDKFSKSNSTTYWEAVCLVFFFSVLGFFAILLPIDTAIAAIHDGLGAGPLIGLALFVIIVWGIIILHIYLYKISPRHRTRWK